jgi:hypothetical protein
VEGADFAGDILRTDRSVHIRRPCSKSQRSVTIRLGAGYEKLPPPATCH